MCDDAMCPDTLFLYFEYDYRFYARDDLSLKEWLPFCMLQAPKGVQDAHREEMHGQATSSTAHSAEQGPPTGAMRTEGGRDDDASSSSKRPRRAGTKTDPPAFSEISLHGVSLEGLERRTGHEMPFGVEGVAPEVCDLVALCNAAHTVGRGDMAGLECRFCRGKEEETDGQTVSVRFTLHRLYQTRCLNHVEYHGGSHTDPHRPFLPGRFERREK